MKIGLFNFKTQNKLILFINEIIHCYNDNKISYTSGSVAYFFTLSLFPFIMFIISLIGLLNLDAANLINIVSPFFPKEIVNIIAQYNYYVASVSNRYVLVISIIISIYSASRAVGSLIFSINSIYNSPKCRNFIHEMLISTALTVALGIILFILVPMVVIGRKIIEKIYISFQLPSISPLLLNLIIILFILVVIFFIMLFLYYFAPCKHVKIKNLIWGSMFSTLGIFVCTIGISLYVRISSRFSLLYGSIGAIIVFMLWFYLFASIALTGAEINRILEDKLYNKK